MWKSEVHKQPNGQEYYFSDGDLYERRGKNWCCVDHIYKEKYKQIAAKIKTQEQKQ